MKQLIIPFVVALAVSTGAATGVTIKRNKAAAIIAQATADSLKAAHDTSNATPERIIDDPRDSTAAKHDSAAVTDTTKTAAEGAHAAPAAAAVPTPVVPAPVPAVKQQAAASPKPIARTNADSVGALSEKRIAKAFASMPPKDAAKVFEVMSDSDVSIILAALSDKESAAIMAKLPPVRVAALSRAGLRNHTAGVK